MTRLGVANAGRTVLLLLLLVVAVCGAGTWCLWLCALLQCASRCLQVCMLLLLAGTLCSSIFLLLLSWRSVRCCSTKSPLTGDTCCCL